MIQQKREHDLNAFHPVHLTIILPLALSASLALAANVHAAIPASAPIASEAAPAVQADAASYSLGLSFSTQWRESSLDTVINQEELIRGIKAGLAGSPLTDADRQRASALMQQSYESWAQRNQDAADAFLAKNRGAANVKTTSSGLQYAVLKAGDQSAQVPGPMDRVTVQYRGHLLDGREFDSTYSRGKPAVVRSDVVIAGWREVLGLMHPGAQWRVYVPPSLGYGKRPPESLPPNSLLVFDIEVLSVERAPTPATPAAAPP